MLAVALDGGAIAKTIRAEVQARVEALRRRGVRPRLVVSLVGETADARTYIESLQRAGARIGIEVGIDALPSGVSEAGVRDRLQALGADDDVHAIVLQQPLPRDLRIDRIAAAIPPAKDADGANPITQGLLAFADAPSFIHLPATAASVLTLLEHSPAWPVRGKNAVVVGRSRVVGLPVALLLLARDATVTITHRATRDLSAHLRAAEIVVSATGVPGLIRGEMLRPGAIVIDAGTTLVGDTLLGDVDYASAERVAAALTPVPGGVGPVTNAILMRNVVQAAERLNAA
ncbi:MAG: bifunctional 5,10-methylenetetrahydrofolate dehydrogenase/5,10-methenyltetrahydrofolate cyclohydrolase [Candidatus Eremiobacteraeota bacterium]|nr:bifunctional 5,10-methylenetetrahydrofolate dehydrogenase/5,10-methenyltetrahydrofolate cyclohydrolase [Candidatus Eremiobacteraeota bacterium]MBV8354984.1 bifunctional 5,10-methylenetetrahydrofolate dehydrogenase/5,10-methenyltetrahydrofolate cyclohydrolase [Candidatus Eremiobacteraeota bacterium]